MTVSAVLSPLMVYLDRFLISAFLSLSAVAYYAAPFDFITRLWIIPGAVSGVLFPALAISLSQDQDRAGLLLARGTKYIFLAVFPVVLGIVIFAPDILRLWLGPIFAQNSTTVTRLLSAGVLVNCLAHMAFTLIQSAGRPDVTAKLHLLEFPIYVAMLLMLLKAKGLEGAALAFLLRLAGDAAVSFFLAHKLVLQQSRFLLKLAGATVAALAVLYFGTLPTTGLGKLVACLGWLLVLALLGGYWALAAEERTFLLGSWRSAAKLDRIQRS
jgi:O-antigen/teichoic acid export membrane protein